MACVASVADQLKVEWLRYNATAEPEMADESNGDCWDLSSEDDFPLAPIHYQSNTLSAPVAGLRAQFQAESDGQQTLSYHNELPQHTAVTNAVKQMLQQDGMVRKCSRQLLTGSAPCLHSATPFCNIQGSLHSTHNMQQQLLALLQTAEGTAEASAAQEYLQQVFSPAQVADIVIAVWLRRCMKASMHAAFR